MPRCYPAEPDFGPGRGAERRVWEALAARLPDDAALLHSVGLQERDREYEADLVVGWPRVGIAVIEVKGGHVTREGGEWFQQSAGGADRHRIDDPVRQAQDARHALSRLLAQRGCPAGRARAVHLLALPAMRLPADWQTLDCPRSMVLDRDDLTDAADRIRRAIETHGGGHAPLSVGDLDGLVDLLEGQLLGQASLLSLAEEHEQRVDQLTRDQTRLLDVLAYQPRLKVVGGAGTGKTFLALEQARRLAAAGRNVALVCYSRGLGRFFERMTATWARRPGYVGLFHDLALAWGAPAHPGDDDSDYFERRLPQTLTELAGRRPAGERFDAVVVDEAQDFGDAWWTALLACLADPQAGGLFVFGDEAQRVFRRPGQVPIPLPVYPLRENVRNTKNIANTFRSLSAEEFRIRGYPGPPVRYHPCPEEEAVAAADDEVDALLADGWPAGDIALLTTGHSHPEKANTVSLAGWAGYWDAFFAGEDVFYGHVLGFKGLERPVVVLAVNGLRDPDRAREYLYVGLSRARTLLVVCGDLDRIAAVGGEGLRRRLSQSERPH